ncbi:MAG TPA: type II toxin-antitoxin system Phd/YefM family antitoxin [Promineifilum sp.]
MSAPHHLGAREARTQFADLLGRVHYGGETIIVERSGKPMAAVIPIELYERLVAERNARFAVIDRLRDKTAGTPIDEVLNDVAEAIDAIRADD